MMKETYIKPEIEIVKLETEPMMLMTSGGEVSIGYEEADESEVLVGRRRGTWGNLWHDEKI